MCQTAFLVSKAARFPFLASPKKINVNGQEVGFVSNEKGDFISLTDMARGIDGDAGEHIRNWMRTGATIEFLGVWERVINPAFNLVEFHQIKTELSRNSFLMSAAKWIERTGAVGIDARAGRYGGTFAHSDIAIQFATWLSPEFYVYLVREFQRLKTEEAHRRSLDWKPSASKTSSTKPEFGWIRSCRPRRCRRSEGADKVKLLKLRPTKKHDREVIPKTFGHVVFIFLIAQFSRFGHEFMFMLDG